MHCLAADKTPALRHETHSAHSRCGAVFVPPLRYTFPGVLSTPTHTAGAVAAAVLWFRCERVRRILANTHAHRYYVINGAVITFLAALLFPHRPHLAPNPYAHSNSIFARRRGKTICTNHWRWRWSRCASCLSAMSTQIKHRNARLAIAVWNAATATRPHCSPLPAGHSVLQHSQPVSMPVVLGLGTASILF